MKGNGWLNHIYAEHNAYQYIFYIIYVKNKKLDKCNLLEKKIKIDLAKGQTDFFPIDKAICLKQKEDEEELSEAEDEEKS